MASSRMALSKQDYGGVLEKDEASGVGVSWAAVFAGAFAMGALALILAVLGAGIGLSSVSRGETTSLRHRGSRRERSSG